MRDGHATMYWDTHDKRWHGTQVRAWSAEWVSSYAQYPIGVQYSYVEPRKRRGRSGTRGPGSHLVVIAGWHPEHGPSGILGNEGVDIARIIASGAAVLFDTRTNQEFVDAYRFGSDRMALVEAQARWGAGGCIHVGTLTHGGGESTTLSVGSLRPDSGFDCYGAGNSWQEAFGRADERVRIGGGA